MPFLRNVVNSYKEFINLSIQHFKIMQYQYPHTITNGGGELLTFKSRVKALTGDWLEGENIVQPGFVSRCTYTTFKTNT
ncbi:MAG: hypothetical protein IPM82_27335 [Saprospiraceae bacterium]|nr:hypothetical protein [Saprospiraceae bacterium]